MRYLDIDNFRGSFFLNALQGGKVLAGKEFDLVCARKADPEIAKRYDKSGFAKFIWQYIEFDAAAGDLQIELKHGTLNKGTHCSRHIDLFMLTQDLNYHPDIKDFYPVFIKFRMLPEQPYPVAIHLFGRRSQNPVYTPHCNINKTGLHEGVFNGITKKDQVNWLKAGDETPWIDFNKYITYGGTDKMRFYVMRNYYVNNEKESAFELLVASRPDDKAITHRFVRKGHGNSMYVTFNTFKNQILADSIESVKSLKYAQAAPAAPGKRPELFPFLTGFNLNSVTAGTEVINNEFTALKLIGINGIDVNEKDFKFRFPNEFMYHLNKRCLNDPDLKAFDAFGKRVAKNTADGKSVAFNMMDEPYFQIEHFLSCPKCHAGFAAYLQANNVSGVSGKPTRDKKAGLAYYWSMRYRNNIQTRYLKAGTDAIKKYAPNIKTTANFATELLGGNMLSRGVDWYEIFAAKALTYGWHENWANLTATYQTNGFYSNVMRSAAGKAGIPYGIYNILGRTTWEMIAKAYLAIGYGNKAMHFFNYGPHYTTAPDSRSYLPETFAAIKQVTFPTSAVEDILMNGKVAKGDVAMLYSNTGDIWALNTDNIYGKERIYLHLLLRHCGYSIDILNEDDLSGALNNCKVLFAVDSHIRRSQVAPLLKWVENGGTLYLGANALMFDEANKPIQLPFARGAFVQTAKAGRPEYDMARVKSVGKIGNADARFGHQKPFNAIHKIGKGQIIASGFFAGLSYQAGSKKANTPLYSVRDYPAAYREYIASLPLPVKPRLTTDNYLVEAALIESPKGKVIVLSNWSGKPLTVTVTLDGKKYTKAMEAGAYIRL